MSKSEATKNFSCGCFYDSNCRTVIDTFLIKIRSFKTVNSSLINSLRLTLEKDSREKRDNKLSLSFFS